MSNVLPEIDPKTGRAAAAAFTLRLNGTSKGKQTSKSA